ncbi:MarR family winged helix-turn-helix transcriptional regulator [Sphaerisporangium sp. NPDC049003]|uniref:MarR family winged helix-turn-helix transcriptional regulator n=1 Tax=Sphaerisporangium sp. NPDC049003 TaxID=3364517 RepID=UPI003722E12F
MLAAVGPCPQQALSEELRIYRSVMVTLCDDLERAGHARRERNPDDRRAYAVTVTDSGLRLLDEAEPAVRGFLDHTFQALTPAERDQLTTLLTKLLTP